MSRLVPSSPHFFHPVKRSLLAGLAVLMMLAVWFPAPLEIAADPATPPNPAKSAWFLLGIQELVSWDTRIVYLVLAFVVLLVYLPWLPVPPVTHAAWFQRAHRPVIVAVLLVLAALITVTAVGMFLRGPNWRLVVPF